MEIKIIEKWIQQGAPYKKHWAFIPPVSPELPEVKDEKWPRNEIDRFILHKMESAGLSPNEEAGKEAMLRRLSIDLTGLPPDIDLQDKFLSDNNENVMDK